MTYFIKEIAVGIAITTVLMFPVVMFVSAVFLHFNRRLENDSN